MEKRAKNNLIKKVIVNNQKLNLLQANLRKREICYQKEDIFKKWNIMVNLFMIIGKNKIK